MSIVQSTAPLPHPQSRLPMEESPIFIPTGRPGTVIKQAPSLLSCERTGFGVMRVSRITSTFILLSFLHLSSHFFIKAHVEKTRTVCLRSCFKDKMQCYTSECSGFASDVKTEKKYSVLMCQKKKTARYFYNSAKLKSPLSLKNDITNFYASMRVWE